MIKVPLTLSSPITDMPHVNASQARALARLGCATVRDLLYHFPTRYEDFTTIYSISAIERDMRVTLAGTISAITTTYARQKRMRITTATLTDSSGSIRLIWFNERFVATALRDGQAIRVSGTVGADLKGLIMTNPAFERAARPPINTARLVPVYPETRGITSRWLRWQISTILQRFRTVPDLIPAAIRTDLHLPTRADALRYIHFPRSHDHATLAQKYFAFEEMLLVQLHALRIKRQRHAHAAPRIPDAARNATAFVQKLPFTLTGAQQRAINAICDDLARTTPMNRLLNGDVGAGKTVVAAAPAFAVARSGMQVALLAPTDVLARQHFANLRTLFAADNIAVALMTGATKMIGDKRVTRRTMLRALADGTVDFVIGTHALITDDVHFAALALVIVDEQHRFGVAQRAAMQQKTAAMDDGDTQTIPHFLSMTATPIPRSLALAFFGDTDLSILDEMPRGRKPIKTTVVGALERDKTYAFIRRELAAGRQAYVILPLVEASGKESMSHVKAATQEAAHLQKTVFADATVGLVHGRMKQADKEAVMRRFYDGAIDVLVATAVVEVGVDVPNATIMIIEGAERFGLSQLHQFRGRIGRGDHQSHCFLFASKNADPPPERLRILAHNTSGFAIAEEDMKLRGPGQFFGTRQSGMPDIAMANITNVRLIEHARTAAVRILDDDPDLAHHAALRAALKHFTTAIHLE